VNAITLAWLLYSAVSAPLTTLSGQVVNTKATPISGARVFAEAGLAARLVETRASETGTFCFSDLEPGGVGVFAIADGYAFGGVHVHVTVGEAPEGVRILLADPDSVQGRVTDFKGKPVSGARVTRAALLGQDKVGIPLAKLVEYGFEEPVSGEDGRFIVPRLPKDGTVALKIGHPECAQEGVDDVPVGKEDLLVSLYPGVLVRGTVRSRDQKRPVLNASIVVRNAQPPHDTVLSATDGAGRFTVRLKPGVYLYQAAGAAYSSMGWRKLTVTGREPPEDLVLDVVGRGVVAGKVADAVTGEPIAGARLLIEASGNMAGIVRTGPSGVFEWTTTEGENVVRLESVPGYRPPERAGQRIQVQEGARAEVPTFWLAPMRPYRVRIVDADMTPVPGVAVQVVYPSQFGWRVTDAEGWAELRVALAPEEGIVVGFAEHLTRTQGALFALRESDGETAQVQLFDFGRVEGRVVDAKGHALEGAVVGACFTESAIADPPLLWRTLTDSGGAFRWPAAVPHVPIQCVAAAGTEAVGESASFNVEPGATASPGSLVVAEGVSGPSLTGRPLKWYEHPAMSGDVPERQDRKNKPALVVYCTGDEAPMVVESLGVMREALSMPELTVAVVVDGAFDGGTPGVLALKGVPPTRASTYLVGRDGKVALETFGMPPVCAVRALVQ